MILLTEFLIVLFILPLSLSPVGVRLTADTVFKLLKKINYRWDWLAEGILVISSSKCEEIHQRYSNEDDCLMEVIRFWMKRCPFASYRWIAYQCNLHGFYLDDEVLKAISQEMHHLLEPIQGKMSGW